MVHVYIRGKKRSQEGFTLVEVIVVAVIVAILAAVSVPLYIGYVNNSRLNAATNAAGSTAAFIGACIAGEGTPSLAAAGATATGPNVDVTCTYPAGDAREASSLKIPAGIIVTRNADNTITAQFGAEGAASPPYAFAAAPGP